VFSLIGVSRVRWRVKRILYQGWSIEVKYALGGYGTGVDILQRHETEYTEDAQAIQGGRVGVDGILELSCM